MTCTRGSEKVKDFYKQKMEVLKPKIEEAVKQAKSDLGKFKKVVVDGVHDMYVRVTEKGVEIVADMKGVWAKVKVAVKNTNAKVKVFVTKKVEEHKPKIIKALNDFKEGTEDFKDFVIEGSKKIYVRISKKGVEVVADAKNVLEKVKAATGKLDAKVRAKVEAAVEKYKPVVIAKLNEAKEVVIDIGEHGKVIVIKIKNHVVEIVTNVNSA